MDLITKPFRVATSKRAGQTYLNTLLFMITSAILLGVAVVAYILFYFNYVPQIGVERIIHLQYGDGPHPYGIAKLDNSIVSQQPYDITLSLHLPRSPTNLEQGNFMLSLSLLTPTYTPPSPYSLLTSPTSALTKSDTLLLSRRPAILTYTSRLVSLSDRIFSLPFYILGLRQESEKLEIPMAERVEFSRERGKVPGYVMLELQAGQEVQVYDVLVKFTARFGGLRWMMYNHRIISFFAFTSAFWFSEMLFAIVGWLVIRVMFPGKKVKEEQGLVKAEDTEFDSRGRVIKKAEEQTDEEPDLSDTPRDFPTYGRQPPLSFRPPPKIKNEDSEEYGEEVIPPLATAAEADDEEEFEEGFRRRDDSGIGTSYSEAGERSGLARRRSRGGRGG